MRVSARESPAYTESTMAQSAMVAQLALEMEAETEAAGGAFHECSSSARLVRSETPDMPLAAVARADAESAPPETEAFFSATQLPLDADGAEDKAIVVEVNSEGTDETSTTEQDTNVDQDAELPPPGRKLSAKARASSGSTLVLERIRNEGLLTLLLQVSWCTRSYHRSHAPVRALRDSCYVRRAGGPAVRAGGPRAGGDWCSAAHDDRELDRLQAHSRAQRGHPAAHRAQGRLGDDARRAPLHSRTTDMLCSLRGSTPRVRLLYSDCRRT